MTQNHNLGNSTLGIQERYSEDSHPREAAAEMVYQLVLSRMDASLPTRSVWITHGRECWSQLHFTFMPKTVSTAIRASLLGTNSYETKVTCSVSTVSSP